MAADNQSLIPQIALFGSLRGVDTGLLSGILREVRIAAAWKARLASACSTLAKWLIPHEECA